MIKIDIQSTQQTVRLEARGHALFAPKGQDLVCCGVSILLQSWVISSRELCQTEIEEESSSEHLIVELTHNRNSELLLGSLILNLGILQEQYPENLKVNLEEIHGT